MITVYSKENCPQCVQAKQYLVQKGLEFQELIVAYDTTTKQDGKLYIGREEFMQKFPTVRAMPYIEVTDSNGTTEVVGTLQNLRKYLEG